MKKIILFVFILSANWCTAQIYVNQQNLMTSTNKYVEVWDKYSRKSGKFYAMVDYGQDAHLDDNSEKLKMHNDKGVFLQFNNVIAILNHFHANGWELMQIKTTDNVESYLLKKREDFKPLILKDPNKNTSIGAANH